MHLLRSVCLLSIFAVSLACAGVGGPDNVVDVAGDDAAMNAAIAEARGHLAVFEAALAKAEPRQTFAVKKPFPVRGGGQEHMWLIDVRPVEGGFEGALDNDPEGVEAEVGKRYTVSRGELSDWSITEADGRIHGAYTIRVLLGQLDEEMRAALEAQLQPLPSP